MVKKSFNLCKNRRNHTNLVMKGVKTRKKRKRILLKMLSLSQIQTVGFIETISGTEAETTVSHELHKKWTTGSQHY